MQLRNKQDFETIMDSTNSPDFSATKALALKTCRFTEMLIIENALNQNGFDRWIFCHGMQFNSPDKWWGDYGKRDYPHEGIDLCLYQSRFQKMLRLDHNTRIPAMHDGVIRAMFKDYLGQAVIIEHERSKVDTGKFITMYAHTQPLSEIEVGTIVKEGDIIGTIADTGNSKSSILPHLHFSIGLPSSDFSYEGFIWNMVRNPEMIILLDPLPVIDWPYQALDAENPVCRRKMRD